MVPMCGPTVWEHICFVSFVTNATGNFSVRDDPTCVATLKIFHYHIFSVSLFSSDIAILNIPRADLFFY